MAKEEIEKIFIGSKELSKYLTAGLWALNTGKDICLIGRGQNIKKTVDVAEILKRNMNNPECSVIIGSEDFENRKVSTIEITLKGTLKKK